MINKCSVETEIPDTDKIKAIGWDAFQLNLWTLSEYGKSIKWWTTVCNATRQLVYWNPQNTPCALQQQNVTFDCELNGTISNIDTERLKRVLQSKCTILVGVVSPPGPSYQDSKFTRVARLRSLNEHRRKTSRVQQHSLKRARFFNLDNDKWRRVPHCKLVQHALQFIYCLQMMYQLTWHPFLRSVSKALSCLHLSNAMPRFTLF